jgi:hypothetical protein
VAEAVNVVWCLMIGFVEWQRRGVALEEGSKRERGRSETWDENQSIPIRQTNATLEKRPMGSQNRVPALQFVPFVLYGQQQDNVFIV